jgi:predicted transposase/invertase (TIGR01784 family)
MNNDKSGKKFSDLVELNILELPKVPANIEGDELAVWTKLLKLDRRSEMERLAKENPKINKATSFIIELSEDEKERRRAELKEKIRMDKEAQREYVYYKIAKERKKAIKEGRQQGIEQGIEQGKLQTAKILKQNGASIPLIEKSTGLSEEEIKKL